MSYLILLLTTGARKHAAIKVLARVLKYWIGFDRLDLARNIAGPSLCH
jgi:hypothetical protein